jgi:protein O-GlcNAc transferase
MSSDSLAQVNALLEQQPTDAVAWHMKGDAYKKLGDIDTAISAYNQALRLKPDFAQACYALAETLEAIGKTEIAIKTYDHWLKILQAGKENPPIIADVDTIHTMERWITEGNAYLERGDPQGALTIYGKLLEINPDSPAGLTHMAAALFRMRRLDEAETLLIKALQVKPGYIIALNILGGCFKDTKRLLAAVATYRQCVAIDPRFINGWSNLGKCYLDLKLYNESVDAYEKALAIDPTHADSLGWLIHLLHYTCRWDQSLSLRQRFRDVLAAGASVEPFLVAVHAPDDLLENTCRWSKQQYPLAIPYDASRLLPIDQRKDGKLRIGYISSDLNRHATTALISEMFEQHDRNHFEIYAYSHGANDGGAERKRVMSSVDVFRDIETVKDIDAAQLIQNDGIDILVDLKGYTNGHRLGIASRRPAPIAMHYLGYPGTIGADFIDYFISDAVTSPEGDDALFHEKLIRLPMSYQINDRKRPLPMPLQRSYYMLPEEGLVFCDFNSVYKIMPEVFTVWMNVLKAIPGSVMWFFITNIHTIINLRNEAMKNGVDTHRLVFGGEMKLSDHLSRYRHVDLSLDLTPCSGHTTASDALWCGAPVVAITGNSFAGRVAAGLLHSVGLPELVTNTLEEYEAKIIELARDSRKLADLRRYLEEGRMRFPLFDSAATTKAIETAYLHAADLHRKGEKPRAFNVPA